MIVVALTTTILEALTPPILNVVPGVKLVPVIITAVPPLIDPLFGLTALNVGTVAS